MEQDKKSSKDKNLEHIILEGAATETVQRYGSAVKQHYVAYSGHDNEVGKQLTKSLQSISESKVNPDFQSQNIKQHAGFAAEVKSVARKNAQNIIDKNPNRYSRTDDLNRVNDPLYDLTELDANGIEIPGTSSQMKFVGKDPNDLLSKLNSKKFQKYIDANAILDVADDDYNALMGTGGNQGIIDNRISNLKEQIAAAEKQGKSDVVAQKKEQIAKYEKIKKNLRKSGLTREESIEATVNPKLSTAKDVVKIAHDAGKQQAKYGAAISGSISIVKNVVACIKGEKTPENAAKSIVIDTGTGTVISYGTAFSGSIIKGAMQNSKSQYVRGLSRTNLASTLVVTTLDVGKILHKYFKGDISGATCVEQLGEQGVGHIGSAMFAAVGSSIVPNASTLVMTIGGIAGATLGYAAAVACYQELSTALKEAEIARIERIRIENECAEAIALIRRYRQEMSQMISEYFEENIQTFNQSFLEMDKAILEHDIDGFISSNAAIQEFLGKEVQFRTQAEFDDLMSSDIAFKL